MELRKFLSDSNMSQVELSKVIGISKFYTSQIVNKRRRPSPQVALRISEATGGQVTVLDLLFPASGQPGEKKHAHKDESPDNIQDAQNADQNVL